MTAPDAEWNGVPGSPIPYVRSRIRQKIAEVGVNDFGQIESWADIRIAISPRGAAEPGRTIEEIAR